MFSKPMKLCKYMCFSIKLGTVNIIHSGYICRIAQFLVSL